MRQFLFLVSLLVASSGCKSGPDVTVCIIDPERHALQCARYDGEPFEMPIADAENFACFSPADLEKLVKACRGAQ